PEVLDRLQDDYYTIREDRYVLPVRSGERSEVPGIIHGNSQTGRTLYIEPQELVPLNNELKICQQAVALEEHRILAELTRDISSHSEAIKLGLELVGQLDMISARARLAQEMDAVCPDVTTSDLSLLGARNPLLVLRQLNVVPNDISFADEVSFLVITGPNAGGKTVTLSTLGLCALMTRAGLHIPVLEGSKVPIYPQILCVVGDQQDMQQDLSTFSGHLAQLHSTINAAASGALVLLDEIAAGTEANQGAALAIAVLEHLATIGASGATTTHYDRLKTLGLEDSRFVNASVTLDPATDDPTFRLTLGTPGTSSALQMARKNGFPEALITRAEAILGDRTHSVEKILRRLDTERAALEEQRCQLEAQQQTLAKETDHHRRAIERLQERGDEIIREERDAVFRDLNEARGALRRIVRELQRDKSPRSVTRRQAQLAELEKRLETHESPVDIAQPARAVSIDIAAPGLEVFVPSFEKDGRIEEVRGKKALVAIGALKTMVPIAELQLPQPKEPEAKRRESPMVEQSDVAPVRTNANTCDVRGMRVDEAIREVERFLDRLLLKNRAAGYILHGYGTGRLKQGLHEAFRRSAYVRQYESASQDRGGDAVTLVWLQ
ncbi:MAG: Smr/MutS family protein, partial [Myxococcota bacterium]|nr:Smr/MutS family protein [Myxococcota bacterium]